MKRSKKNKNKFSRNSLKNKIKYGGASFPHINYKNIAKDAVKKFGVFIDPRYKLTINISDTEINIVIDVKPKYNNHRYHHNVNINEKGKILHDKCLGQLKAFWHKNDKSENKGSADLTILQAGFWLPERLINKPNPLAGVGIGKFLMIIFDWICKDLGIVEINLDNNTKPMYNENGNKLPSYYSKFGFRKVGNENEPEMVKNQNSPLINTYNMLNNLKKYNPTDNWIWQFK